LFEIVDRILNTLAGLIAQFPGLIHRLVKGVTHTLDSGSMSSDSLMTGRFYSR
jgi:hypothetical protein